MPFLHEVYERNSAEENGEMLDCKEMERMRLKENEK